MTQKQISVLSNLRVAGAIAIDKDQEFDPNAKIGTLALKDKSLYAKMEINGFSTWYPIFQNVSNAYQHTQAIPNLQWTVQHNLNSQNLFWAIKNAQGQIEHESTIEYVDNNTIKVNFYEAVAGTMILVGPTDINLGLVNAQELSIGTSGAVTINNTGVFINGQPVLTGGNIETMVATALSAQKGAANGIAALDADGKVPATQLPSGLGGSAVTSVAGRTGAVTLAVADISGALAASVVGAAGGVASLDGSGKVPAAQLPSYVDDVLEYADLASLPASGDAGKIYVALNNGKIYRWSGSSYVEISGSPGSTDSVTEGSVNLYFTAARAQAAVTSVSGNAGTATKLATARSIGLGGSLSGSANFDGSADITINATLAQYSVPYDLGGSIFGVCANSEVALRIRACRAFRLASGQANGQAKAGIAATGSTVFTIAKNGVSVGSITFAAGSSTGTFSFTNNVDVATGDLITVTGPATADATLADVDFTLVGNV